MNILIALLASLVLALAAIGTWFSLRVLDIARSQVQLKRSIDAGDTEAIDAYFREFAARHNKGV